MCSFYGDTRGADSAQYKQNKAAEASRYKTTQEVEAARFRTTQDAEAGRYQATQEAEARLFRATKQAEGDYLRVTREAEAACYAKMKEAEGITAMARAYGELGNVLGGPQGLLQYMMLQSGTYEKLAAQNASAIRGLQPKINVWNTGSADGAGGAADASATIRNIFQNLPPLLQTVQEQTGISPPTWLAQMPGQQQQGGQAGTDVVSLKDKKGLVNGK